MESDIFEVIETALKKAGYRVLDGDRYSIVIRHENSDTDYKISVNETQQETDVRDPERIAGFAEKLGVMWKNRCPDWRFGQLISNFMSWYRKDIFFLEEEEFLKKLEEFLGLGK